MEDLDFDELDKAVGKMMSRRPGRKPSSVNRVERPASRESGLNIPAPRPVEARPSAPETQPDASSNPQNEPSKTEAPKIPPRHRMGVGAMDIIRPATSSAKVTAPSQRPSRTAASIQPIGQGQAQQTSNPANSEADKTPKEVGDELMSSLKFSDIIPPKPKQAPQPPKLEPPQPEAQIAKPQETEPAQKQDQPKSSWEDPLEYLDFDNEKPEGSKDESQPKSDQAPEATPFITTKVEKRPLGGYATNAAQQEEAKKTAEPSEQPPKAEMAEMSLESGHHLQEPEQPIAGDMSQMKIPGQEQRPEGQPSDEIRGMYDTKEYHAPPEPIYGVHHRGNPWLVVVIVVLITLLVGAVLVGYLISTGMINL